MFELHPYQHEAIQSIRDAFRRGKRSPCLQLATGGGKTVVASEIIKTARAKGSRAMFTVPRIDLVDQTVEKFFAHGIDEIGVIQADHPMTDYAKPVQVASLDTLGRRGWPEGFDLIMVDECHMQRQSMIDFMTRSDLLSERWIGLSATPWARGMGQVWDDLIVGATMRELIDTGFLSDYRVYAPSHPDLRHVGIVAGDYNENHLSTVMRDARLVGDVVQNYIEHGEMRPALCFAVDCAHARALTEEFNRSGVTAFYQDAHTPADQRKQLAQGFKNGRFRVGVSVGTLTTGVDWDVRCIILARPTKSHALLVQIIGRGLRTAEGKRDCLIFDHTDTILRLGMPADIHFDGLDDGDKNTALYRANADKEKPKPKECSGCGIVKPPATPVCPVCGTVASAPPNEVEAIEGELEEIGGGKRKEKPAPDMATKQSWYNQLTTYQQVNGKKEGWIYHKYKAKFGESPANGMRAEPEPVSPEVASWIRAQNIRYAKSRKSEAA